MSGALLGIFAFLSVATSMAFWFRRIQKVDIPEDRRGFVACWVGGAGLGIAALIEGAGWIGGVPAGIAILGGLFFSALVFVSPQKVAGDAIRVGDRLRSFTALDENGDDFAIDSVIGKPLLLKFFRGHW